MLAQLWEWTVVQDAHNHPVGICGTEQRAMHALSKALIAAGEPATGHITPMTLIRPMHTDSTYLRQPPQRTAVYDGTAIQWH